MAASSDYRGYGERIGEYVAGSWDGTANGANAEEEIDNVVGAVLAGIGRTKVEFSGRTDEGALVKEYYAEPSFEDPDEAVAAGVAVTTRWETWLERSLQPICTDQAGSFEPGQISRLQQAVSAIKAESPGCAIQASAVQPI